MAVVKRVFRKVEKKITPYALNTADAARYIGVSESLMRKMRSEGNGPKYSMINTKIVYLVSNLQNYLKNKTVNGGCDNA